MLSRRILLAISTALALVLVSGASGEPINGYTATGSPSHVKPSTQTSYTIALTNDTLSPGAADRAKIGIPPGFVVAEANVQPPSTTAAGDCVASTWVADGTLVADGKINLKRPNLGGGANSRLCPGATLTVVFSATSAAADSTYIWATELLRGDAAFVLSGSQPTVQVDGTPPVVTISSHPANPSNVTSPSFTFSATEPASFQCKLDGGAFAACTSPTGYGDLGDGSHTFAVKATDAAGNTGVEASYTWLIETNLPIVTLTEKPSQASKSSAASFAFTASKPATFECKLDGGAFAACTSPTSYSDLGDGSHTFTAKATDNAGNTGPETTHAWTIDTVSPAATITQKPSDPSNDASPTFEFSASETASFECQLDGAAFTSCKSPKSYTPGNGAHTFTVKATDAAGNADEATYGWTIDTVPPTATITQKPPTASNNPSPTFAFSASEAVTFLCKLDTGASVACTSPHRYSDLEDGPHTFTIRATDNARNAGEATYGWTIDTMPPTATIAQKPNNPSNVKSPTFEFSASEAASFQCKLDGDNFTACSSPKTYINLADGAHTFTVKATDAAGNTGEASHSWLLETDLPIVTLTQKPTHPSKSSSATFAFEPTKPATLHCRLDDGAFAPCVSPAIYTNLGDGPHTFAVKATDAASNTGPETIYTWTIDTVGPTAAITQKPGDPTNSRSASFEFAASEPATFQCKLDDAAFASCAPPQAYGNLADGRHTFAVRASDALSNLGPDTVYAWTIETRAPAVAVTSAPVGLSNSTSASFSFSADEPSTFQCNLDDRGFEPCSSPASYAGLRDGGHAFAVRATDAAGNVGAASRSWTIDVTAPQTTLDSAPATTTTATSAAFGFSASEPATFQCRLDGGSFSPCGSPKTYAGLASGLHRFAVRAIDAAGNVDATPAGSEWTVAVVTRTVASSALFAPAAGARVTRPPLLRWRPVRGAAYYNVQLYRAGRKVLTAWPTQARLQLRARWRFDGRVQRLAPGVYRWFVWPGHGQVTARRYGRVLGASTFVVRRAAPRR